MTALLRRSLLAALAVVMFPLWAGPSAAQVLLRDAEIESWIERMSFPIFEAAGVRPESVDIYLIGDPTPNAAAGGLNMLIHTGLITIADTPNQVEGVIAHETGHIAGGHSIRTAEAIAAASRPAMLSLVLGAALLAVGAPPELGISAIGAGQQLGQSSFLSFSRGQESAADQAAISYLEAVGSSSKGLVEFFGKLQNRQLISGRQPIPYLQTHPLALQRSNVVQSRGSTSEYWDDEDSPEEIFEMNMIQAKIVGFMNEPFVTQRLYPLTDQSDPARYARAVAYYRGSDLEAASREIDYLIGKYPDNPYFHELKGQMLFEHGRALEAIAPHRTSTELAPQFALLKINLGRALVSTEDEDHVNEAIVILNEALRIERDNAFGWTELARAHGLKGDDDLAALAQAEAYYHYGASREALRFAMRARDSLRPGTPEHQQALDIIVATADQVQQQRRR
ncbi:MAG: M48 family metalloprotease [Pseudomonadota bacterium]